MKTILIIVATAVALIGCQKPAETRHSAGAGTRVEKLFTHEGCTVYRFFDDRTVYYTKCEESGTSEASWQRSCGKGCTRNENVNTGKEHK